MVWNVLWMAAMAAASVLAGFCMGRLSVRTEDSYDEGADERIGQHGRVALEMEAVGEWNVRPEQIEWAESEMPHHRKMESVGRNILEDAGEHSKIGQHSQTGQRMFVGTAGWLSNRVIRGTGGNIRPVRRSHRGRNQQTPEGQKWSVGSPVKGWVTSCRNDDHPTVVIQPEEDRLYAPAGGKIIKLFPMGNAFLFRTDFGTEIYMQVGNVCDDLLGRYFRPRVVQNEIVGKGKLLLEFDSQMLVAEGISPAVTARVENYSYSTHVHVTAQEQVRVGEEILLVSERQSLESLR